MNLNNFTLGAGLFGGLAAITAGWGYVQRILRSVSSFFIGSAVLKYRSAQAVSAYCMTKSIRSPLGRRVLGGVDTYVHPKRWTETVAYEELNSDPFLIKHKGKYALIARFSLGSSEKGTSLIGHWDCESTLSVYYLRGLFDIEDFLKEAIDYLNKQNRQSNGGPKISRFRVVRCSADGRQEDPIQTDNTVEAATPSGKSSGPNGQNIDHLLLSGIYRLLHWKREDLQYKPEEGQTPFTGYPFPPDIKSALKELERWKENEKWYRSKSIPWRLGWLLYGPPGTGKSTLVRAIGMTFDMPVFSFDLAGMTNREFSRAWDSMLANTPCIPLIEDFDTVFEGRKYIGGQGVAKEHLTFDCVLNCISGVKQSDGVFLVVTTNRVETIDTALGIPDPKTGRSSRPGRIDKAIFLGPMRKEERLALAQHILSDFPLLVEPTVEAGEGETAAQFQARCADLALSQFWNK